MDIPGYRILDHLASGAQGDVYLAEQTSIARQVALKTVRFLRLSDQEAARLGQEARALALVDSPHVVKVHDFGMHGNIAWLAMELVRGGTLESRLQRLAGDEIDRPIPVDRDDRTRVRAPANGRSAAPAGPDAAGREGTADEATQVRAVLPSPRRHRRASPGDVPDPAAPAPSGFDDPAHVQWVEAIGSQLCGALITLHARGLVHRDIKPANVLLVEGEDRAILTDFGLAKSPELASLSVTGQIVGTIGYMSPEQARGLDATPSSDVYALAATLYHGLVGAPPFDGPLHHVVPAIADVDAVPVCRRNPSVPIALSNVIQRALAKRPEQRPATAAEFAEQLDRARRGLRVPRPPRRRSRRARAGLIAGWLAIAGLLMLALAMRWLWPIGYWGAWAQLGGHGLLELGVSPHYDALVVPLAGDMTPLSADRVPGEFVDLTRTAYVPTDARRVRVWLVPRDRGAWWSESDPVAFPIVVDVRPHAVGTNPTRVPGLDEPPATVHRLFDGLLDHHGLTWSYLDIGARSVPLADGGNTRLALGAPLRIAPVELPATIIASYVRLLDERPTWAALFKHPDEPAGIDLLAKRSGGPANGAAATNFWLAFRVVGSIGCRLPSQSEWVAAVLRDSERDWPLAIAPTDVTPRAWSTPLDDVFAARTDDVTASGLRGAIGSRAEWTTTPAPLIDGGFQTLGVFQVGGDPAAGRPAPESLFDVISCYAGLSRIDASDARGIRPVRWQWSRSDR